MSEKTELLKRKKQLENEISRYKNLQLAKKVQLNSDYRDWETDRKGVV